MYIIPDLSDHELEMLLNMDIYPKVLTCTSKKCLETAIISSQFNIFQVRRLLYFGHISWVDYLIRQLFIFIYVQISFKSFDTLCLILISVGCDFTPGLAFSSTLMCFLGPMVATLPMGSFATFCLFFNQRNKSILLHPQS